MDSGYLAILLLVVGLALIVCEVFIPSAGLIATLATLCIAGSVAAAWSAGPPAIRLTSPCTRWLC